ncbi:NAD(P)-dependent oxidoreductase [Streptomyces pactum]|uniref:NAD(P)-dependent oxidoreductase n=1 Tax=Streptomyces pactum TaxID=68249 RepID=A0ABS0NU17_9ACTN|nr:NAD(P)-dependent oxidoreductase [Streptomyces pactum]MBH5338710.1 NAD(P)-dependent oxidoreductase [Streptomyces pactum]
MTETVSETVSGGSRQRRVAVLGTGIIGAPVAVNLSGSFAVRVWNRTRAKADALAAAGGIEAVGTPAEAVTGADVVVTVLKDGAAVLEAMEAAAAALSPGTVWVQLSTVGVTAADELMGLAERHGLVYFDAPVLGTRQPAEQGKLVVLASGPVTGREAAQRVFDVIGGRTVWVAEEPGAGSRLKLALNTLVLALTHGTAESLAVAKALGVDPALVVEVVSGGPLDSGYFRTKASAMLGDDYTTNFSLSNAAKDAQLVVDAAEQAGITVDGVAAGLRRSLRAIEAGHGDKDMAASYLAG